MTKNKQSDTFACGIRFMMAIDPQLVDNFFMKVRETIDPYDCRCQLVTEEVSLDQVEFGVLDSLMFTYLDDFGDDPLHWNRSKDKEQES